MNCKNLMAYIIIYLMIIMPIAYADNGLPGDTLGSSDQTYSLDEFYNNPTPENFGQLTPQDQSTFLQTNYDPVLAASFYSNPANLDHATPETNQKYFGDLSNIGKNPQSDDAFFSGNYKGATSENLRTFLKVDDNKGSANKYFTDKFKASYEFDEISNDFNYDSNSGKLTNNGKTISFSDFSDKPKIKKVVTIGTGFRIVTEEDQQEIDIEGNGETEISVNEDGDVVLKSLNSDGVETTRSFKVHSTEKKSTSIKYNQDGSLEIKGKVSGSIGKGKDFLSYNNHAGKLIIKSNGDIFADNAEVITPLFYADGNFHKEGNEVIAWDHGVHDGRLGNIDKEGRTIIIDKTTRVGAKTLGQLKEKKTSLKVHLFKTAKFSENYAPPKPPQTEPGQSTKPKPKLTDQQKQEQIEKLRKLARTIKPPIGDIGKNGEVWINRNDNQEIIVTAKGLVDVGFYNTDPAMRSGATMSRSEPHFRGENGISEFDLRAGNVVLATIRSKAKYSDDQYVASDDDSYGISTNQDGSLLRVTRENSHRDGIIVDCNKCEVGKSAANIKKTIALATKTKLRGVYTPDETFIFDLDVKVTADGLSYHPSTEDLGTIADKQGRKQKVILGRDMIINVPCGSGKECNFQLATDSDSSSTNAYYETFDPETKEAKRIKIDLGLQNVIGQSIILVSERNQDNVEKLMRLIERKQFSKIGKSNIEFDNDPILRDHILKQTGIDITKVNDAKYMKKISRAVKSRVQAMNMIEKLRKRGYNLNDNGEPLDQKTIDKINRLNQRRRSTDFYRYQNMKVYLARANIRTALAYRDTCDDGEGCYISEEDYVKIKKQNKKQIISAYKILKVAKLERIQRQKVAEFKRIQKEIRSGNVPKGTNPQKFSGLVKERNRIQDDTAKLSGSIQAKESNVKHHKTRRDNLESKKTKLEKDLKKKRALFEDAKYYTGLGWIKRKARGIDWDEWERIKKQTFNDIVSLQRSLRESKTQLSYSKDQIKSIEKEIKIDKSKVLLLKKDLTKVNTGIKDSIIAQSSNNRPDYAAKMALQAGDKDAAKHFAKHASAFDKDIGAKINSLVENSPDVDDLARRHKIKSRAFTDESSKISGLMIYDAVNGNDLAGLNQIVNSIPENAEGELGVMRSRAGAALNSLGIFMVKQQLKEEQKIVSDRIKTSDEKYDGAFGYLEFVGMNTFDMGTQAVTLGEVSALDVMQDADLRSISELKKRRTSSQNTLRILRAYNNAGLSISQAYSDISKGSLDPKAIGNDNGIKYIRLKPSSFSETRPDGTKVKTWVDPQIDISSTNFYTLSKQARGTRLTTADYANIDSDKAVRTEVIHNGKTSPAEQQWRQIYEKYPGTHHSSTAIARIKDLDKRGDYTFVSNRFLDDYGEMAMSVATPLDVIPIGLVLNQGAKLANLGAKGVQVFQKTRLAAKVVKAEDALKLARVSGDTVSIVKAEEAVNVVRQLAANEGKLVKSVNLGNIRHASTETRALLTTQEDALKIAKVSGDTASIAKAEEAVNAVRQLAANEGKLVKSAKAGGLHPGTATKQLRASKISHVDDLNTANRQLFQAKKAGDLPKVKQLEKTVETAQAAVKTVETQQKALKLSGNAVSRWWRNSLLGKQRVAWGPGYRQAVKAQSNLNNARDAYMHSKKAFGVADIGLDVSQDLIKANQAFQSAQLSIRIGNSVRSTTNAWTLNSDLKKLDQFAVSLVRTPDGRMSVGSLAHLDDTQRLAVQDKVASVNALLKDEAAATKAQKRIAKMSGETSGVDLPSPKTSDPKFFAELDKYETVNPNTLIEEGSLKSIVDGKRPVAIVPPALLENSITSEKIKKAIESGELVINEFKYVTKEGFETKFLAVHLKDSKVGIKSYERLKEIYKSGNYVTPAGDREIGRILRYTEESIDEFIDFAYPTTAKQILTDTEVQRLNGLLASLENSGATFLDDVSSGARLHPDTVPFGLKGAAAEAEELMLRGGLVPESLVDDLAKSVKAEEAVAGSTFAVANRVSDELELQRTVGVSDNLPPVKKQVVDDLPPLRQTEQVQLAGGGDNLRPTNLDDSVDISTMGTMTHVDDEFKLAQRLSDELGVPISYSNHAGDFVISGLKFDEFEFLGSGIVKSNGQLLSLEAANLVTRQAKKAGVDIFQGKRVATFTPQSKVAAVGCAFMGLACGGTGIDTLTKIDDLPIDTPIRVTDDVGDVYHGRIVGRGTGIDEVGEVVPAIKLKDNFDNTFSLRAQNIDESSLIAQGNNFRVSSISGNSYRGTYLGESDDLIRYIDEFGNGKLLDKERLIPNSIVKPGSNFEVTSVSGNTYGGKLIEESHSHIRVLEEDGSLVSLVKDRLDLRTFRKTNPSVETIPSVKRSNLDSNPSIPARERYGIVDHIYRGNDYSFGSIIVEKGTGKKFFVTNKGVSENMLASKLNEFLHSKRSGIVKDKLKYPEMRFEDFGDGKVLLSGWAENSLELKKYDDVGHINQNLITKVDPNVGRHATVENVWVRNWDFKAEHMLINPKTGEMTVIDLEKAFGGDMESIRLWGGAEDLDIRMLDTLSGPSRPNPYLTGSIDDFEDAINVIKNLDDADYDTIRKLARESGYSPSDVERIVLELQTNAKNLQKDLDYMLESKSRRLADPTVRKSDELVEVGIVRESIPGSVKFDEVSEVIVPPQKLKPKDIMVHEDGYLIRDADNLYFANKDGVFSLELTPDYKLRKDLHIMTIEENPALMSEFRTLVDDLDNGKLIAREANENEKYLSFMIEVAKDKRQSVHVSSSNLDGDLFNVHGSVNGKPGSHQAYLDNYQAITDENPILRNLHAKMNAKGNPVKLTDDVLIPYDNLAFGSYGDDFGIKYRIFHPDEIIGLARKDKNFKGETFEDAVKFLSDSQVERMAGHETFHAAYRGLLTPEQRKKWIDFVITKTDEGNINNIEFLLMKDDLIMKGYPDDLFKLDGSVNYDSLMAEEFLTYRSHHYTFGKPELPTVNFKIDPDELSMLKEIGIIDESVSDLRSIPSAKQTKTGFTSDSNFFKELDKYETVNPNTLVEEGSLKSIVDGKRPVAIVSPALLENSIINEKIRKAIDSGELVINEFKYVTKEGDEVIFLGAHLKDSEIGIKSYERLKEIYKSGNYITPAGDREIGRILRYTEESIDEFIDYAYTTTAKQISTGEEIEKGISKLKQLDSTSDEFRIHADNLHSLAVTDSYGAQKLPVFESTLDELGEYSLIEISLDRATIKALNDISYETGTAAISTQHQSLVKFAKSQGLPVTTLQKTTFIAIPKSSTVKLTDILDEVKKAESAVSSSAGQKSILRVGTVESHTGDLMQARLKTRRSMNYNERTGEIISYNDDVAKWHNGLDLKERAQNNDIFRGYDETLKSDFNELNKLRGSGYNAEYQEKLVTLLRTDLQDVNFNSLETVKSYLAGGSQAKSSTKLSEGDLLISIDGIGLGQKNFDEVLDLTNYGLSDELLANQLGRRIDFDIKNVNIELAKAHDRAVGKIVSVDTKTLTYFSDIARNSGYLQSQLNTVDDLKDFLRWEFRNKARFRGGDEAFMNVRAIVFKNNPSLIDDMQNSVSTCKSCGYQVRIGAKEISAGEDFTSAISKSDEATQLSKASGNSPILINKEGVAKPGYLGPTILTKVDGYNDEVSVLFNNVNSYNSDIVFSNPLPQLGDNIYGAKAVSYVQDDGSVSIAFLTESVNTHHRHALAELVGGQKKDLIRAGDWKNYLVSDIKSRSLGFEFQFDRSTGKIIGVEHSSEISRIQRESASGGFTLSESFVDNVENQLLGQIDLDLLDESLFDAIELVNRDEIRLAIAN